jgi:hypothetical protein
MSDRLTKSLIRKGLNQFGKNLESSANFKWVFNFTIGETKVQWIISDLALSIMASFIGLVLGDVVYRLGKRLVKKTRTYLKPKPIGGEDNLEFKPRGGADGLVPCLKDNPAVEVVNTDLQNQILKMLGETGFVVVTPGVLLTAYANLELSGKINSHIVNVVIGNLNLSLKVVSRHVRFALQLASVFNVLWNSKLPIVLGSAGFMIWVKFCLDLVPKYVQAQYLKLAQTTTIGTNIAAVIIGYMMVKSIQCEQYVLPVEVVDRHVVMRNIKAREDRVLMLDDNFIDPPIYSLPDPLCGVEMVITEKTEERLELLGGYPIPRVERKASSAVRTTQKKEPVEFCRPNRAVRLRNQRTRTLTDLQKEDGTDVRNRGQELTEMYNNQVKPRVERERIRVKNYVPDENEL